MRSLEEIESRQAAGDSYERGLVLTRDIIMATRLNGSERADGPKLAGDIMVKEAL